MKMKFMIKNLQLASQKQRKCWFEIKDKANALQEKVPQTLLRSKIIIQPSNIGPNPQKTNILKMRNI